MIQKQPTRIALILIGLYSIIRGLAYLPPNKPEGLPGGLELISEIITIEIWGSIWLLIGVFAVFSAVMYYKTSIAWGLTVGIMLTWGSAFMFGAVIDLITNTPSRAYLSATSYMIPGLVIAILSRKTSLETIEVKQGDGDGA